MRGGTAEEQTATPTSRPMPFFVVMLISDGSTGQDTARYKIQVHVARSQCRMLPRAPGCAQKMAVLCDLGVVAYLFMGKERSWVWE